MKYAFKMMAVVLTLGVFFSVSNSWSNDEIDDLLDNELNLKNHFAILSI